MRDGAALTPPLDAGLLPGITREFVFEIGRRDRTSPCAEATLRLEDLLGADEAFVTGTTRELTPVVRVDDQMIGTGKPGPITRRLLETFHTRALELVRRPSPMQAATRRQP